MPKPWSDHSWPRLPFRPFGSGSNPAEYKRTGSAGGIKNAHTRIKQTVCGQTRHESIIHLRHDKFYNFRWRVVDTELRHGFRVEDPQKIFVQIKYRVSAICRLKQRQIY